MDISKYMELRLKQEEKMVEALDTSISSLLQLLKDGDEKTSVPFSVYANIFTQVLNMNLSPESKKKMHTLLSKQITNFMKDKIISAFDKVKETDKELAEKFIKYWLITSKLKLWMEKICKYLNFDSDPSTTISIIFGQNVYDDKVKKGINEFLIEHFKTKSQKKDDDDPVSEADKEHIKQYGFTVSDIYNLPHQIQQILSIIVEIGKESSDFEDDKDFSKYVGNYLKKILDEKKREEAMSEFYNSQSGHTYYGRSTNNDDDDNSYGSGGYSSYRDYLDEDDTTSLDNAEFFQGKKGSKFGDGKIDEVIKKFRGEYEMMEDRHNYVQFFFPIRESGMSSQQALTKHESELFKKDKKMRDNLINIYEVMLDFYGIKLKDRDTGEVERAKNWQERFENLNDHGHNNLRITRILKCLGLTGLEHFKKHLVKLFIVEVFQNKQLQNVKSALVRYWMPTLRSEADLIEAEDLVKKITGKRVSRKVYDKEKRTWANVVIPLKKDEKGDEKKEDEKDKKEDKKEKKKDDDEKTFYNRDDDDKSDSESIVDISSPRRHYYSSWNNDDDDDDKKNSDEERMNYYSRRYNSSDEEDLDDIDEELEEDFDKKYN